MFDQLNQLGFVLQIEHMQRQRVARRRESGPHGAGGGGHDYRERRKPMRIAQVERNLQEPRAYITA